MMSGQMDAKSQKTRIVSGGMRQGLKSAKVGKRGIQSAKSKDSFGSGSKRQRIQSAKRQFSHQQQHGRDLMSAKSQRRGLGQPLTPVLDEYDELDIKEDLDEDDSFYDNVDQKIQ